MSLWTWLRKKLHRCDRAPWKWIVDPEKLEMTCPCGRVQARCAELKQMNENPADPATCEHKFYTPRFGIPFCPKCNITKIAFENGREEFAPKTEGYREWCNPVDLILDLSPSEMQDRLRTIRDLIGMSPTQHDYETVNCARCDAVTVAEHLDPEWTHLCVEHGISTLPQCCLEFIIEELRGGLEESLFHFDGQQECPRCGRIYHYDIDMEELTKIASQEGS